MTDRIVLTLLAIAFSNGTLNAQFSINQITDKDPAVRQSALRHLAALPAIERERYIPALVDILRSTKDDISPLILGLVKIGPPAVPALRSLLADPSTMRGCAAEALAMIRPLAQQDIDRLQSMLKDDDEWVRQRVAESLLSAGVRNAEAELIVGKEVGFGHSWGAQAPGEVTDWIASFSLSDPITTSNALFSLNKLGEPAVPNLVQALQSPDANVRAGAAEALQEMHIYRADLEEAFIRAINDPSQRVRDAARFGLDFTVSQAAKDALLRDQIAEVQRRKAAEQRARADRTRPHTLAEILAVVPPDPDNTYASGVADQFETKAPDGTVVLIVLHSGPQRSDLLRVWAKRNNGYFLVWEDKADNPNGGTPHLSAGQFHFRGLAYVHVMRLWDGTGYQHEDIYFRVANNGVLPLKVPEGLPVQLAAKEGVWKGYALDLKDDHLDFQFWIWNEGDANCCPTAGTVTGSYTIVSDELRYASWKRSPIVPQ